MQEPEIVVVNTTPLIALADIGYLDILQKIYGEIHIPIAVLNEIKSEPAKSQVKESTWIKIHKITKEENTRMFSAKLHAGEVEVMILAEESHADLVIMDDNAAKKTAKFMGMRVTGTLGVLIYAKELGLINKVEPLIDALIEDGLYISDRIRQLVLKQAGEE